MWQTISYVSTANPSLTNSDVNELFEFVKLTNNNQNLYKKIELDSRHYNVIKIFDKEITNCSFSQYHSSFKVLGDKYNHKELQHFLREEKSHNPDNYKNIFYLANKFMKLS